MEHRKAPAPPFPELVGSSRAGKSPPWCWEPLSGLVGSHSTAAGEVKSPPPGHHDPPLVLTAGFQVFLGVEVTLQHALVEEHVAHGLRDDDVDLLGQRDLLHLPRDDHDPLRQVVALHQNLPRQKPGPGGKKTMLRGEQEPPHGLRKPPQDRTVCSQCRPPGATTLYWSLGMGLVRDPSPARQSPWHGGHSPRRAAPWCWLPPRRSSSPRPVLRRRRGCRSRSPRPGRSGRENGEDTVTCRHPRWSRGLIPGVLALTPGLGSSGTPKFGFLRGKTKAAAPARPLLGG